MRKWVNIEVDDVQDFVNQLIAFSGNWPYFLILDSNNEKTAANLYPKFEIMAACGSIATIQLDKKDNFGSLKMFALQHDDWIFGHLSYDLKNELEKLSSKNTDSIGFPELFFFVPKYLFKISNGRVQLGYVPTISSKENIQELIKAINGIKLRGNANQLYDLSLKHNFCKNEYVENVKKIQDHILKGDVYELNFCTEFLAKNAVIDAPACYRNLKETSPSPFSAYYKLNDKYLLSSSPERFLAKRGNKIISQPIKGTIKRGGSKDEDNQLKLKLQHDVKERAENIMIVDLVRNDLSKTAKNGSVAVEELCNIYSYKYVHQMVSTVISEIDTNNYDFVEVIKNAFPMGSMTGAPKIRAMELIEKFEKSKRGLYSGSVGYITPEKDFDFNVVIRSILYNKSTQNLSFSVGSAITFKSVPEKEYEECLLKAEGMKKVLLKDTF